LFVCFITVPALFETELETLVKIVELLKKVVLTLPILTLDATVAATLLTIRGSMFFT
jgi:hypothetical protein